MFDYEGAERDILDAGGDPDYLDYCHEDRRDRYMRKMGLNPDDYQSHRHHSGGKSSHSSHSDDGCFLTAACTATRDLPDDCYELETLRKYRDTYLQSFEEGRQAVEYYYKIAPKIVTAVNEKQDAKKFWNAIYNDVILPCIDCIEKGENAEAYTMYRNCVLKLEKEFL